MLRRALLERAGLTAMLAGLLTWGPAWTLHAQDEAGGDEAPPAEGGGDMGGGAPAAGGGGGGGGPVDETQVKELFREGIRQYLVGKPHDAAIKLESALRMDPPGDLVMFLRDEAGYDVLVDMLSQPELKHTALRIMELSKGAQARLQRSAEEIQNLVDGLKADTFDQKMEAVHGLCAVGQRAVPALIENLRDNQDPNLGASTVVTLTKMGGDAVLPLHQACRSKTPFLRQQAALVLGNIKDQRSVPELKRMLEDPAELPEVKNVAAQSIQKITGKTISSLMHAKEYYAILSDKFVMGHPSVMPSVYGDYVLWRWDAAADAMEAPKDLPEFAYNELLATEAARDAIALDPNYDPAWVALALAQIAYGVEAKIALEALGDAVKRGEVDQAVLDKAKADLAAANRGPFIGQLAGRQNLYRALKRSLDEDKADIAVACIEALSGIADPNDLPPAQMGYDRPGGSRMGYPLVEALINDDKRVRYAAADALVRINPERLFLGADRVIATLGDAAGESSAPPSKRRPAGSAASRSRGCPPSTAWRRRRPSPPRTASSSTPARPTRSPSRSTSPARRSRWWKRCSIR
ncbi:MAG: HEAT repeat domain-containing protein [Planctomycetes bacterium]|nr:HEAT repeat domain-containing protein [Planctomycetota bacterium]